MSALTLEDLRQQARRRLPSILYDYIDSGSWTQSTYHANRQDLQRLHLRQRVGLDVSSRSSTCSLLGQTYSLPLGLAPAGMTGLHRADGEILAARAAAKAGVPFILSTFSTCPLETVARESPAPIWFQLYPRGGQAFTDTLIGRAWNAGCPVLVLTLDLPVMGQRHKDVRNGLSFPLRPKGRQLASILARPAWCLDRLRTRHHGFGNFIGHVPGVRNHRQLAQWMQSTRPAPLDWAEIARIRQTWPGRLLLKGILDAEDARQAQAIGADGIVVSNHGGRQLDSAPSSISMLKEIVGVVGKQLDVLMDGGISSGQDVLKALALGARGVLIGRPYLYGLAAQGEAGVSRCIEIIQQELDLSMALCGIRTIDHAGPETLAKAWAG